MIERDLRENISNLLRPAEHPHPTMDTVRHSVEKFLRDKKRVRNAANPSGRGPSSALPPAKLCIRKMMGRYWENFSPFALDLCSAVMRQGVFIDKMVNIDWLHSPSAKETMDRLIIKYHRFISLMGLHPNEVLVPTLDVDLAWHTHQLSPVAYYTYTRKKCSKFIDHDDKIDEDKLGEAFEFTTKAYQRRYDEIYSECTCWYCEGRFLSLSTCRSSNCSSNTQQLERRKFRPLANYWVFPTVKSSRIPFSVTGQQICIRQMPPLTYQHTTPSEGNVAVVSRRYRHSCEAGIRLSWSATTRRR